MTPKKSSTQTSISGFFAPRSKLKRTASDDSDDLLEEVPIPDLPAKKVKLDIQDNVQLVAPAKEVHLEKLDSSSSDYPPPDHPSYHFPPSSSYNHPISIKPIPESLLSNLTFNTVSKPIVKENLGLDLLYFKKFIDSSCSAELVKYLLDAMPWYRVQYTVRGIHINTPRWTTVFGKDSTFTPWDGYDKAKPRAIPPILLKLMQKVEQVTGDTYNFALVNYYASGNDSISYHSDSESFLGRNPCIASISLGASRDFLMRHIQYKISGAPVEKFQLQSGDMVVMRGRTQHDWQHSIPKRSKADGRINITFRKGIVKYATQNYNDYNVGKGPMYRWQGGKMVEQKGETRPNGNNFSYD